MYFEPSLKLIRFYVVVSFFAREARLTVFILEDALSVWTNLGKHSLFVWLFVSGVKTSTRRIIHLYELSTVVRLELRTTEDMKEHVGRFLDDPAPWCF